MNTKVISPTQTRYENLLNDQNTKTFPLWMMRQAGRYLPEYQSIRKQHKSFLDLCSNPLIASSITLQPLARFELDAAIIFADILLPLLCIKGLNLIFDETLGPVITYSNDLFRSDYSYSSPVDILDYVGEAIMNVSHYLDKKQALIGFCGSPWTVAMYAWQGSSVNNFKKALDFFYKHPVQASQWLELLSECSLDYLKMQVRAGATQIMIFDSWAFLCPKSLWNINVYTYTLKLMKHFKQEHPHIPLIYYPRGMVIDVLNDPEQPFDILACDSNTDIFSLQNKTNKILQGNFRSDLLLESKEFIEKSVEDYFSKVSKSVIVNLGQGINPLTPVEHVDAFVKAVRYQEKRFSHNHST